MARNTPGSKRHLFRYKFLRIVIATVGMLIACGMSAFVEYYFHLVDFLSLFVNGIIRVMAIILFFSFLFMYVRYLGSLNFEYCSYYGVTLTQKPSKFEAKKQERQAKKLAAKEAKKKAQLEKQLQRRLADEAEQDKKQKLLDEKERAKAEKLRLREEAERAKAEAKQQKRMGKKKNKTDDAPQ